MWIGAAYLHSYPGRCALASRRPPSVTAARMKVSEEFPFEVSRTMQHIPDLFLIENDRFLIEEWREEARLLRLAAERPHHFCKDESGVWHYYPVEEYLAKFGIDYRLRSADEHPRSFIANIWFLEDYSRETTPAVPDSEANRLLKLLQEAKYLPHLQLVYEHKFSADHTCNRNRAWLRFPGTTAEFVHCARCLKYTAPPLRAETRNVDPPPSLS